MALFLNLLYSALGIRVSQKYIYVHIITPDLDIALRRMLYKSVTGRIDFYIKGTERVHNSVVFME